MVSVAAMNAAGLQPEDVVSLLERADETNITGYRASDTIPSHHLEFEDGPIEYLRVQLYPGNKGLMVTGLRTREGVRVQEPWHDKWVKRLQDKGSSVVASRVKLILQQLTNNPSRGAWKELAPYVAKGTPFRLQREERDHNAWQYTIETTYAGHVLHLTFIIAGDKDVLIDIERRAKPLAQKET